MRPFVEYHRPKALDEALELLARPEPRTRPLAGGTSTPRGTRAASEAVVDLCDLHLDQVSHAGAMWSLGATVTLEALSQVEDLPPALRRAALRQAPRNVRQRTTLGGMVATARPGPLLACLLAMDCQVQAEPAVRSRALDDYLASLGDDHRETTLITGLTFPAGRYLGMAEVARTPADAPILTVAVAAAVTDGRLSHVVVAAGGVGQAVVRLRSAAARLEGLAAGEIVRDIVAGADETRVWRDDLRGSAAYRRAMVPVLSERALGELWTTVAEVHGEG